MASCDVTRRAISGRRYWKGENLPKADVIGLSDPYCILSTVRRCKLEPMKPMLKPESALN